MDIDQLRNAWQQQEEKLEATRALNVKILKELKLEHTKSKIKRLLCLPVSTLLFCCFIICYATIFIISNFGTWYFVFSGIVILFFAFAFVFSSVHQLRIILSLDYQQPITILQRELSKLKLSVIYNLKIAAAVLPFSPFIGIFTIKAILNFDITEIISLRQVLIFAGITVILQLISLFFSAKLSAKNKDKNYMNWLLKANGSQINEAKSFLSEIEDFK